MHEIGVLIFLSLFFPIMFTITLTVVMNLRQKLDTIDNKADAAENILAECIGMAFLGIIGLAMFISWGQLLSTIFS